VQWCVERVGDAPQHQDRWVSLAAFGLPQVRDGESGGRGEVLEREVLSGALLAYAGAELT
jgi:hypothetical protein